MFGGKGEREGSHAGDVGIIEAGGGDAGSMCDMQAWACELSFENARSCRLARKHMDGRRLRLRSEKVRVENVCGGGQGVGKTAIPKTRF